MRKRKTYQNRGQKRRIKMSKSTGRIRKGLTRDNSRYGRIVARDVRHTWRTGQHLQGVRGAYKRKRYYKRNLSFR